MASKKDACRRQLTPEDWIRGAIEALLESGTAGLRIASLARRLGVTPGSFHWHFTKKERFREQVLEYWMKQMVQRAGSMAEQSGRGPEQVRALGALLVEQGLPDVDVAMRHWARSDDVVAEAVARADAFRIRRVTGMFVEAGFDEEAAAHRARMLLWLHVGSIGQGDELRRAALGEFLELVLRDPVRKEPVRS